MLYNQSDSAQCLVCFQINIFLTLSIYLSLIFYEQIYWYMYLMQNADNYFSNLLVFWLSCFLIQLAAYPPPPWMVNMQFLYRTSQFVIFQYQLFSFCIYSAVVFDIAHLCRFIADIVVIRTYLCQLHITCISVLQYNLERYWKISYPSLH